MQTLDLAASHIKASQLPVKQQLFKGVAPKSQSQPTHTFDIPLKDLKWPCVAVNLPIRNQCMDKIQVCQMFCTMYAGDITGFVLTILVLFIAAGGGIGGGGAIIPLYLLFLGSF